jgi:hypothetical protein
MKKITHPAKPIFVFTALISLCLCGAARLWAANPTEGTVDPSTTTPLTWSGTAIGTGGTD